MRVAVACLALLLLVSGLTAAPIGWRTDGTGMYPTATPPASWAPDSNVVWSVPMPSWSNATPTIVGDRIFVCTEPDTLMCLSKTDGSVLWQAANSYKDVATAEEQPLIDGVNVQVADLRKQAAQKQNQVYKLNTQLKDKPDDADLKAQIDGLKAEVKALNQQIAGLDKWYVLPKTYSINGFSTPTPVSDGKHVWALFNHGVAACYDLDGKLIWRKYFERPNNEYGHSASPVFADGKLIIHVLNLMGLDPMTGEPVWKTRLAESWGTPQVGKIGETEIIITPAGDVVRATDGKVLAEKLTKLEYGDPILADGNVYFIQNGGKGWKLPASATAEPFTPELLWETQVRKDRYYAASVLHEGIIYGVTQTGIFSAVDAATGQVIYEQALNEKPTFYPAITFAGGLLYVSNDKGATIVVKPGRVYEEVSRLKLEPFRSCPVFEGNRVYVRGLTKMWCLGTQ